MHLPCSSAAFAAETLPFRAFWFQALLKNTALIAVNQDPVRARPDHHVYTRLQSDRGSPHSPPTARACMTSVYDHVFVRLSPVPATAQNRLLHTAFCLTRCAGGAQLGRQAALTAIYDKAGGPNLLRYEGSQPAAAEHVAAWAAAAFDSASPAMTTCDYGEGLAPLAQVRQGGSLPALPPAAHGRQQILVDHHTRACVRGCRCRGTGLTMTCGHGQSSWLGHSMWTCQHAVSTWP